MNFFVGIAIKYYMPKKLPKKKNIITFALIILIIAVIIAVPTMAAVRKKRVLADSSSTMLNISVWQIDGFEGGKGSRASYLQNTAKKCFDGEKTYFIVTSLTADAARENINNGVIPDIISYPAGFYGIENLINKRDFTFKTWARGAYCLLSLEENADFSDVNAQNTVINVGKDNLVNVTATLCGLNGAVMDNPTNAYLKLINGKYKYLLGTQRDIFRLNTRGIAYSVKAVGQFNDLYQNISVLTTDKNKYQSSKKFVEYLLDKKGVGTLGLFCDGGEVNVEQLRTLQEAKFETVLNYPCGKDYVDALKSAAQSADVNKIKTLLK